MNKTLDELQISLEKIDQLLRTANMFGGSIKLDDELITSEDLEDLKEDLQFKIAVEISNRELKVIK